MYYYIFLLVSFVLAIILSVQDCKNKKVNLLIAIFCLIFLNLNSYNKLFAIAIFVILLCYFALRKKILARPIDLLFLSSGVTYFKIDQIPFYFLLIGMVGICYHIYFKEKKLPFITIWTFSFYILIFYFNMNKITLYLKGIVWLNT